MKNPRKRSITNPEEMRAEKLIESDMEGIEGWVLELSVKINGTLHVFSQKKNEN